ncbi:MAG: bifunctional phosphoglucose/phosphomannose isomerase [Chloroflexi bacterium]|nr:MAG: bifunctional phosphoglucose/phosphomannose isomerase [Chloroflexota bacterium]HDN80988.1 bifunctional phosphoglucose/phosphomannose isomerase [Chloroflexota bacterium]
MTTREQFLNDPSAWLSVDEENMLSHILNFPCQCRDAWREAEGFKLPPDYKGVKNVLIIGMGGSAIGGDLVAALVRYECPVPIYVCRDYRVPHWVGPETLAIGSSYSGNTEETLSAFREALDAGAKGMVVTTDGKLGELAQEKSLPLWNIRYRGQPRAVLGYSFLYLLRILEKAGLVSDKTEELERSISLMEALQDQIKAEVPSADNPAKQVAINLHGRIPVIYGAGHLAPVARRWKGQFNENSKNWGFFEELPELNHNAVVGFSNPVQLKDKLMVILLASSLDHERHGHRFTITREILEKEGVPHHWLAPKGESPLEQMLWSIHFGDFVSYYLALLNRADPTPVDTISYLKKRLAELGAL